MTDHATRAHARFGASSAHRWFACPGSVALTAGMPDEPGPAALEGTRAHELLEALLRLQTCGLQGGAWYDKCRDAATKLWEAAPQDMRDAVHVCVDHVKELVEDHPDAVVLVEHRFEIPVAAAPGEVFGTNDVCVFLPSVRTLHVVDYKHGAGTFVDVRGNKQLRFYALGAIAGLMPQVENGTAKPGQVAWVIDTVVLTIVQPRCAVGEPVREEWLTVEEVLAFGPVIGDAVTACKTPDAPLVPGEDQCRFCKARTVCPARERQALAVFDGVTDVARVSRNHLQVPAAVPSARLAELLGVADEVRAWFRDLEDEAEHRLRAGEDVPGWKLVEAQARRQWVEEDVKAVARQLSAITHVEMNGEFTMPAAFKVEKLRTLGEVEAILKQGCDRKEARRRLDAMAYLTTKKSSGALKLARAGDSRPAAALGSAFDGVVHVEEKR